jgi:predicted ArsR family transcriptional regulator
MIAPHLLARLRRRGQAQNLPKEVAQSTTLLGEQARRILDDEVFGLAIDVVGEEIVERWRNTKLGDEAGRETLYLLHCALREVEARLRNFLGDANRVELERQRRDEERDWAA